MVIKWLSVDEFQEKYPGVDPIPGTIIAEGDHPPVQSIFLISWGPKGKGLTP